MKCAVIVLCSSNRIEAESIGWEGRNVSAIGAALTRWKLDVTGVRERVYRARNPRESERWQALWLLARGLSATEVAAALERDPHTIGVWLHAFEQDGPQSVGFEQTGGPPPR